MCEINWDNFLKCECEISVPSCVRQQSDYNVLKNTVHSFRNKGTKAVIGAVPIRF